MEHLLNTRPGKSLWEDALIGQPLLSRELPVQKGGQTGKQLLCSVFKLKTSVCLSRVLKCQLQSSPHLPPYPPPQNSLELQAVCSHYLFLDSSRNRRIKKLLLELT